jgi:outer membrane lipoprotein SlyB
MTAQANKPLHLPKLVGGIAAILVSGIAIASLTISAQGHNGVFTAAEPPEATTALATATPSARAYWCPECGVIVSTREIEARDEKTGVGAPGRIGAGGEIEGTRARNYEITIRLKDGSMSVITDPNPARWRQGERVTLIAGVN